MTRVLTLFLILLNLSCLRLLKPKSSGHDDLAPLAQKAEIYLDLVKDKQDQYGFIMTDKCDSLLFTGLLSAARPELGIDIHAAQAADGSWHRRPSQDCGPRWGNSRSTVSRDMVIGLMWHLWEHKDLETAHELFLDLKQNLFRLRGDGTTGELQLTPAMITTLAHIVKALGGPRYELELALPPVFISAPRGFVRHLSTWLILLHAEAKGGLSRGQLAILSAYAQDEPDNPLFLAAYHKYKTGNQRHAAALLMDEAHWPAQSLPTTDNHCAEWPIQRDTASDNWQPCSPLHEHTGAELNIIYKLIMR